MPIQKAAVLICSHNRRELTLAALATLFRQRTIGDLDVEVFLVDDGSSDGTGQSVRRSFPTVHILAGDGSLYWNGGMSLALGVAMNIGFDAYIFMNDDTMLYPDALERLVWLARERLSASAPAIVVGSTRSRRTGKQSYGGLVARRHGLAFDWQMVEPHPSAPAGCETMHGNFVLIPNVVLEEIGPLDRNFRHQFGDLDFGLRATAAGFAVIVVPGFIGDCSGNSSKETWRDRKIPLSSRWRHLRSPKGVPFREWFLFTRRHYGWRWIGYACSPYLKTLFTSLLPGPRRIAASELAIEEGSCDS